MTEREKRKEYLLWKEENQGLSLQERQELRELLEIDWRDM